MNWDSWSDFWAMGGHGVYVWGAYLVAVAVIATEIALLMLRRRTILDHLGRVRHGHRRPKAGAGDDVQV
jgi:heme exporter protein D